MASKRHKFTDTEKRKAVDEYVSGTRTEEVSKDLGIPRGYLYKWRVHLDERAKGERIEELEDAVYCRAQALIIERLTSRLPLI